MSEPINLDLVELRCKLRGWTLVRAPATCPRPDAWTVRDAHGITVASHGYTVEIPYPGTALLTAPRWTLERLLTEPPEGWRVVDHVTPRRRYWQALLAWGESYSEHNHELSCALGAHPQSLLSVTVNQTCASHADLARLAERHKAAADLALILAEVEP